MKITYSVGVSVPGGGIGNVALHALKALNSADQLHKAYLADDKTRFLEEEKVQIFPFLNRIPSYLLKDNLFDYLVSRKITKTDIFHGWNNYSLLSLRKAKKLGAKVLIERASSHINVQNNLLREELKKFNINYTPVNSLTLKKSLLEYDEADYIIVPSEFAYNSFLTEGYPPSKLKLLNFGVDLNKFTVAKNKTDDVFRVIFVGQVGVRKGLPYLLQAWEELDLKNSELVIIGPVFPDFRKLIKNYSLNKVRLINYSNNLPEYYAISDVFVFPSIEEGSALVTYEAMASGLPIICTFNSGSIVKDGQEGFLVEAGNAGSLKESLLKLYNNRDLISELGKNARRKIEKYSWENYEKNLLAVYREIQHD